MGSTSVAPSSGKRAPKGKGTGHINKGWPPKGGGARKGKSRYGAVSPNGK